MQSQQPSGGQTPDPREGDAFFLNVAAKLDTPFPDFKYFREHRPVFHYPPLATWFLFRYDDVSNLLHVVRLARNFNIHFDGQGMVRKVQRLWIH